MDRKITIVDWGGITTKGKIAVTLAVVLSSQIWAEEKHPQFTLPDVVIDANVTAQKALTATDKFQGSRTIDRKIIEASPAGNGDFTRLLRSNPSVQFGNRARQSNNMGEINVADVSINGARYWQNSFLLDGVSINNDINPAASNNEDKLKGDVDGPTVVFESASQGLAIDSDLLESISVKDSDVSAKYGSFTGGVVEAKTRNPKVGFHGKFSLQHTSDKWSQFHAVDKDAIYNSQTAENQPKFSKWITRLNLEGFLREDFGALISYSSVRSKIPLKETSYATEKTQRRQIDNFFLKGFWLPSDRLTITPSITYAPQSNKYFTPYAKDSTVYMKSGGINLNLNAVYDADFAKIHQTIGYNVMESSRYADVDFRKNWVPQGNKNWSPYSFAKEGGYGDIVQEQKSFSYNADLEFKEFDAFGMDHKIISGLEFKKQTATHEYPSGFTSYQSFRPLGHYTCRPFEIALGYCVPDDGAGGQFATWVEIFDAGKIKASAKSYAAYIEDEAKFKNLTLRAGFRYSGDDYTKKWNLAPRFSSAYDVFDDDKSVVTFGLNRYYARNLFYYKLSDGKSLLRHVPLRPRANPNQDFRWRASNNMARFSEIKVPYDDELSVGFKQKISDLELALKYVKREGKDQIQVKTKDAATPRRAYNIYTNEGRSRSETFTVTLKNLQEYRILNTDNSFEIAFDHISASQTGREFKDLFEYDEFDRYVMVDGKIMKFREMPIDDFSRPWTLRLNTLTKIPSYGLSVNNFFIVKSAMDKIVKTGRTRYGGEWINVYETTNLGRSYTWDMRIGYEKKLPKNISGFINLDVFNVLSKKNKATVGDTLIYDAGRQFWLEAGVKW